MNRENFINSTREKIGEISKELDKDEIDYIKIKELYRDILDSATILGVQKAHVNNFLNAVRDMSNEKNKKVVSGTVSNDTKILLDNAIGGILSELY